MTDRTLPLWLRAVLLLTGLMQFSFGLTVLLNPGLITDLWPWPLSPLSARLLGASSLVSVPLSIFTALLNRWSAARIPLVMLLTYRVLQVLVGLIHISRFDFTRLITWNYFGGGTLLGLALTAGLIGGSRWGRPAGSGSRFLRGEAALNLGLVGRAVILAFAAIYLVVGVTLLILGHGGAWLWFEAPEAVTPLTLRLFASPTTGLALGLWLVTRSARWRQAAVPATAFATIGFTGSLALLLEWASIQPPTWVGYYIALTPLFLLLIGLYLLLPQRARA